MWEILACKTIVVLTPHVPVFYWPSRHNFRDIELIFKQFFITSMPLISLEVNFKNVAW